MSDIPSYILFGFLWLISLLPFRVLYLISDLIYPLIYYLFRYRRKVVYRNLEKSFPEKSREERKSIEKKFYRHLCDVIVESVKIITYPIDKLLQRIEIRNLDIIEQFRQKGRHAILSAGHYANWEFIVVFPLITEYHTMAVYKPLHDKVMDRLVMKSRTKGMDDLIPMHKVLRTITRYHRDHIQAISLFIADQTPVKEETEYFTWFLNQETAAFTGIEKIARKFNEGVFFCRMDKVKRGKYLIDIVKITTDPNSEPPHAITDKYFDLLETYIREKPELWLWSHRRWKFDSRAIPNRKVDLSPRIPKKEETHET